MNINKLKILMYDIFILFVEKVFLKDFFLVMLLWIFMYFFWVCVFLFVGEVSELLIFSIIRV